MSWTTLLIKALPQPEAIAGMLYRKEGLELLINQADGDDKKNIIGVRNKAKELSKGKGIPEGLDAKEIQSNATTLVNELNKRIKELNSKSQDSLETKLETIIENEDKDGLIKLVGITSPKKMTNKVRKRKIALLKKNKSRILDFVELTDIDLFYFKTDELTFTATKPIKDNKWEDKVEKIKTSLQDIDANIEGTDNITISFNDKTNWSDIKTTLEILNFNKKRTASDILFKQNGKLLPSPLLEIFKPDEKTTSRAKSNLEVAETKNYQNNVSTAEHALNYLKLLTSHKIMKSDIVFMPNPKIQKGSNKTTKNAKLQLLGNASTPKLSSSLDALFTSASFDLKTLMQAGEKANAIKYSPTRMREILDTTDEVANLSLTTDELDALRKIFKDARGEFPLFIKRITGKKAAAYFRKLQKDLINLRPNLFTENEKEMLESLKDKNPRQIKRIFEEFYKDGMNNRLYRLLENAVSVDRPFQEIEGGYKFRTTTRSKFKEMRELDLALRKIRQNNEEGIETFSNTLEDSLKLYTQGFKVNESGKSSPVDMLHFLYVLDLYYGRTGFKTVAKNFKSGNVELKELLDSAQSNYQAIIQGFIDKVKDKIDEILNDKEEFQNKFSQTVKGGKQITYELFNKLESNSLISSKVVKDNE